MEATLSSLGIACRKIVTFKRTVTVAGKKKSGNSPQYTKKVLQGHAFLNLKMYKKAVKCYKKALKIKSDEEKVHYSLGNAYRNLGMFKEAIKSYKYVVHMTPNHATAHYYLGTCHSKLGKYKQARDFLNQSVTINPKNANAHYSLGVICLELLDNASALKAYKSLRDLSPQLADKLSEMLSG